MELTNPDLMRALMDQRGLSGRRLAHNARCTEGMIRHLLTGRNKSCTPGLARRICKELGLSDESLLFVAKVRMNSTQPPSSGTRKAAA